ncbi:MAG: hypothetical protein AB1631_04200 [Acidobacteriota bacterium]
MKSSIDTRARERGAVKIQTVLTFLIVGMLAFAIIKIAPIYVEQRSIQTKVDELARVSALRNYKPEKVNTEIEKLINDNDLPAGSVTVAVMAENKVHLKLKYTRTIDFLVTQYDWAVDYTAEGRAF